MQMRRMPPDHAKLDALLKKNRRIDRRRLRDALELIRELEKAGLITEKRYELLHPFAPRLRVGRWS